MNRDSAKKLLAANKCKFLRWDAHFDRALIKTPQGADEWIKIKGTKSEVLAVLKRLKASAVPAKITRPDS